MKSRRPRGERPRTSDDNQARIAPTPPAPPSEPPRELLAEPPPASVPAKSSDGIARNSRKPVSRERRRSSVRTSRTGCGCAAATASTLPARLCLLNLCPLNFRLLELLAAGADDLPPAQAACHRAERDDPEHDVERGQRDLE